LFGGLFQLTGDSKYSQQPCGFAGGLARVERLTRETIATAERLFKRVKIYFGLRSLCQCGCQVFLLGRVSPYWKKIKKMLGGFIKP
jgi:hypothetical protein